MDPHFEDRLNSSSEGGERPYDASHKMRNEMEEEEDDDDGGREGDVDEGRKEGMKGKAESPLPR